MSDKANKARPRIERLARMEGSTSFRDLREGFGAGRVELTDQDIMAAIGMIRRLLPKANPDDEGKPDPDDIGPECLETYFGSSARHRRKIVQRYMRATHSEHEPHDRLVARRFGATLAAQQLAGVKFTRGQWTEFAWLVCCRRDGLERFAADALCWFYGEVDRATQALRPMLAELGQARAEESRQHWDKMRGDPGRARRIAVKLDKVA